MKKQQLTRITIAALAAGALFLTGCKSAPVYNVVDAPITTSGAQLQSAQVRNAIIQAGTGLGWQMREERPGLILASLNLRSHMALVEIPYDTNSYSIRYRDSTNLKYDGSKIHSNYNGWVQNLDNAIRGRLLSAS